MPRDVDLGTPPTEAVEAATEAINTAFQSGGITHAQYVSMVTALQLLDNFISGSRGLVTEDNSAAIKTAVELIDNMISGNEAQVDVITLPQREPFMFRPGQATLASGMVASGTRSGSAEAQTDAANTTKWLTEINYTPERAGLIDGKSSGGVVHGQICIGIKSSAATPNGKLTARIRKVGGAWITCLALTGAFALSATEIFKVYDIPFLLTVTNFNAVPFEFAIGVESDHATNDAIARIMETSFIAGEFEPGTS